MKRTFGVHATSYYRSTEDTLLRTVRISHEPISISDDTRGIRMFFHSFTLLTRRGRNIDDETKRLDKKTKNNNKKRSSTGKIDVSRHAMWTLYPSQRHREMQLYNNISDRHGQLQRQRYAGVWCVTGPKITYCRWAPSSLPVALIWRYAFRTFFEGLTFVLSLSHTVFLYPSRSLTLLYFTRFRFLSFFSYPLYFPSSSSRYIVRLTHSRHSRTTNYIIFHKSKSCYNYYNNIVNRCIIIIAVDRTSCWTII